MNFEPLMEGLVQTILFLELSDDDTVDEDAAVALLEAIAALVQRLGPAEQSEFLSYVNQRAHSVDASTEERECIRALPASLGLV
jgi:hypothetical protein